MRQIKILLIMILIYIALYKLLQRHLGSLVCIYYIDFNFRHKEILETMENPLIFPKLKKLLIDFNVISAYTLIYIDFTCCANTLESMVLHLFGYGVCHSTSEFKTEFEYFSKSLKHLKKLHNLTIIQLQYEPLWESLKEIKTLR